VAVDLVGLFSDLVRLETDLWNRVDIRMREEHGLPLAWFEPMQIISATPDCRVFDIAEALLITVGGTSKLVDKIEAHGWCRRLPNPTDGRSNLIELTASGEALLQEANVTFGEALAVYVGAAAPASDLNQLSGTLRRLRRHLMITADRARPAGRRQT
jgi:DNA-binding MarR family transcriptional regulator